MNDGREDLRQRRQREGAEIDREFDEHFAPLVGSTLPPHLVDRAIALAARIDSHLHDMAANKQEDSQRAKQRTVALGQLLEWTEDHRPDHPR